MGAEKKTLDVVLDWEARSIPSASGGVFSPFETIAVADRKCIVDALNWPALASVHYCNISGG